MHTIMTQTKPRKSSMMERLRRLHSGLKAADSRTTTTTTTTTTKSSSKRPLSLIFTIHPSAHKPVVGQQHHRPAFSAITKTRARHNEYALDLEQLDSKLEKLALSNRDSVEAHAVVVDEILVAEPQCNPQKEQDSKTRGTASRQTARDIEIIVHPPAEEATAAGGSGDGSHEVDLPQPHVSDFDIFLQQAAEDERRRTEREPKSNGERQQQQQQPQLNQFYSNNWTDSSSPKLAEIHEHEDKDKDEKTKHEVNAHINSAPCSEAKEQEQQQPQQSQQQTCASRGLAMLSSTTTRSLSPDLAGTPGRRPVHTQTWPGAPVARHVSFQEPVKAIRGRTRSNPNLYHVARCAESPQGRRAFARRKSIRRAITDYMRQLA